jgi:hypothetical protein
LPIPSERPNAGGLDFFLELDGKEFYAKWETGGCARAGVRVQDGSADLLEEVGPSGPPSWPRLMNLLLTRLGNATETDPDGSVVVAHECLFAIIRDPEYRLPAYQ